MQRLFLITILLHLYINCDVGVTAVYIKKLRPCVGADDIEASYFSGRLPGEENQYNILLTGITNRRHNITIVFESEGTILRCTRRTIKINETVTVIEVLDDPQLSHSILFLAGGPTNGPVPYLRSIKYEDEERCVEPIVGYLDKYLEDVQKHGCGRRKIEYVELVHNAASTAPGEWPWHAALFHLNEGVLEYKCGGTLVTKAMVLTAAHCVATRLGPFAIEILRVGFGRYNLEENEMSSQTKEVNSVIVHERFGTPKRLDNDIALIKLKDGVKYTEYVQRACIWNPELLLSFTTQPVLGSVVGWGYDETNTNSMQLKHTSIPERTYAECILKYPTFYDDVMKNKKTFCAGWGNGTSPCNGDSGGGFLVFVPDPVGGRSSRANGRWYIKGLVSLTLTRPDTKMCDPYYYVVFTDVAKYFRWIHENTDTA